MDRGLFIVIAIALGIAVGFLVSVVFNKLPESWLQDYGYDPSAPDFRLSKRMKLVPHTIISCIFCVCAYAAAAYFNYSRFIIQGNILFEHGKPIRMSVVLLAIPVIMIVMISDRLNRIIPDQCWIALLLLGIISAIADFTEGSVWYYSDSFTYWPILSRFIAMLLGAGVLFLIEFICETFLGREGMGQGDMKLLGACGMLVGLEGMLVLVYVAVFSALIFAIPLFINKRLRIAREEKEIRESANPVKKRQEIRAAKANIHFADDPDYLAFGPFLALGAAVYLVLEPVLYEHLIGYYVVLREIIFHV